jgi:hypothetical protein
MPPRNLDLRLVFAGFAAIFLALLPPLNYGGDGDGMLNVATSLATGDIFTVPCGETTSMPGHDGACYSRFYPLISLLALPFVLAGRMAASLAGVSPDFAGEALAMVVPALAAAGAATLAAALAVKFGAGRRGAVLAACATGLGSELLVYSRTFYAETLAAFLVALIVWGLTEPGRRRWWGLAAIPLLILAKPQLALVGGAVALVIAARERRPRLLAEAAAASLAGATVYGAYNWLRFRDITDFGGEDRQLHGSAYDLDALEALALLTVSPGRGLLWFSPVVFAGLYVWWRRRGDTLVLACAAALAAVLIVHVGNPGTGWSWGSRYLASILPLLCAAAGSLTGRGLTVTAALALAGFVIALPTTVTHYERYFSENAEQGQQSSDRYWTFPDGPLLGVWGSAARQLEAAADTDVRDVARDADPREDPTSVAEERPLRTVAAWWWMLPVAGLPWLLGLGVALALIAAGAWLLIAAALGRTPDVGGTLRRLQPAPALSRR